MSDIFYVDNVQSAKDLSEYLKDIEYIEESHPEGTLVKTQKESIVIIKDYIKYVQFPHPKETIQENDIIFGKNPLERIVSIDITEDGKAVIFTENKLGEVETKTIDHTYWTLFGYKPTCPATKLKGSQWYKWEVLTNSKEEFKNTINQNRKCDPYTIWNEKEALMVREGYTYFKGMKHDEVSILSFDIETNGLTKDDNSRVVLISNTFRKNGIIERKLFAYNDYENDGEMIYAWCNWVREKDPSVICGHNIIDFDLPFLNHVAELHSKSCNLGRDNSPLRIAEKESKFRVDGSRDLHYHKISVFGRSLIDTMFLAYRYDIGKKYESYGLKYIIKKEKLEKKDRVFYDASTIRYNYLDPIELEKIKRYAIDDGDDSLALYDKFSPTAFYLANSVPKPFQTITESAPGSQINSIMVRAYYQQGHSVAKASEAGDFQGAISFGIPGIYDNVMKIDFKRLYPSIMMQYNVCDKVKDPQQIFPLIVRYYAKMREEYRAKFKETNDVYYDNLQNVVKTIANSTYGFLSTKGMNYNSPSNASFITAKGREFLSMSVNWATGKDVSHWISLFEEKTK